MRVFTKICIARAALLVLVGFSSTSAAQPDATARAPDDSAASARPGTRARTAPETEAPAPKPVPSPSTPPTLSDRAHGHPPYPEAGDGDRASVLLEIHVDQAGRVQRADLVSVDREGPQAQVFVEAARAYVFGLSLEPAHRGGQPIAARVRFEVVFTAPSAPPHSHQALPEHHHHADGETHLPHARPNAPEQRYEARAVHRAPLVSPSSAVLHEETLRLMPRRSTGDLLNAAPGFLAVQHAGGGKANQYFLRGFDADHGTDVAFRVDRVPENHVSHGHGQGFTNLNWVIPELISQIQLRKGTYYADAGDFATAGVIDMRTRGPEQPSYLSLVGGSFKTARGVAVISPKTRFVKPLLAAEVYRTSGPYDLDEELLRINGFGRISVPLKAGAELSLTLTSHTSDWNASGQIPLREVRAGKLSRFGHLDPNEGGSSDRHSVYLGVGKSLEHPGDLGDSYGLTAYLVRSRLSLYSNFTFYARNPVDGDMIRQSDARTLAGIDGRWARTFEAGSFRLRSSAGLQVRHDLIANNLADAPARQVSEVRADASIGQTTMALFAEQRVGYSHFGELRAAVRGSALNAAVQDQLTGQTAEGFDTQVSPKASLTITPLAKPSWLAVSGHVGLGYHSNDVRLLLERSAASLLTPALGYEVGVRSRPVSWLALRAALFRLDLKSELVWVGDEGSTETGGRSRREGVEAGLTLQLGPWLSAQGDVSFVRAHLRDAPGDENQIPLAPRQMVQASLVARHAATGLSGRIGVRHVGDRPATEDGFLTAQKFTLIDVTMRYDHPRFALALTLANILNARWRQAQFATTSRLPGEENPSACPRGTRPASENGRFAGCEDLSFTAGAPLDVKATATVKF